MATEVNNKKRERACLGFDGLCPLCTAGASKVSRRLEGAGFEVLPMQDADAARRLGLDPDVPTDAMRLVTASGEVHAGVDAYLYMARFVWWLRPLTWIALIPGGRKLLDIMYRFVARHRRPISRFLGLRRTAITLARKENP